MPKLNGRAAICDRLARRANQVDPKRAELLHKILEESSSALLNNTTIQHSPKQALDNHAKLVELIEGLRLVEANCNPELPTRNEQACVEFFSWIDSYQSNRDKGRLSGRLSIAKLEQAPESSPGLESEWALIAKVPFKKGENIFEVCRKVILSTETVTKDSDLYDFVLNDSIASAMQNVILVLHLLNEHSKGDKSHWKPYIAILPDKILPVLQMDSSKLKGLLASSHLFEVLKMIRAISRQYSYFFKRLQSTNLPLKRNFTYDYYCWGVSIVCSRQNEIPPSDRRSFLAPVVQALIPVLDMCNHDSSSNQATFEGKKSCLVACKDLKPDEEITINYGCRSSGDFYIHNGFVPEKVRNDIVPLSIALNTRDPLYIERAKLLKTLNMPTFGYFKLTRNDFENRHKRDPHLTMFLIVFLLNKHELETIVDSDNPVGIADEVYEHVQYHRYEIGNEKEDKKVQYTNSNNVDEDIRNEVFAIKSRLARSLPEYLSKRAAISIALINRVLNEEENIDNSMSRLLRHEKSLLETYLVENSEDTN